MAAQRTDPANSHETDTAIPPAVHVPAAELMSFLREVSGSATWTEHDLAKSLRINASKAKEALTVLQVEGYAEPAGRSAKWRTTEAGVFVSGAKPPRYTRASVEAALSSLQERIRAVNQDPNARHKVLEAVAFGDFLLDRSRVQAAEVGVRVDSAGAPRQASAVKEVELFLRELRGKSALLRLLPYEPWMSARSHRKLL